MATGQLTRNQLILAKIESVYATDPTPTGAANAMLASNISPNPLNATNAERNNYKGYLGVNETILADVHSEIDFDIEMQASGAVATPPAYGVLLRACGLAETITASTNVFYKPVSSSFESCTIYYFNNGVLWKMLGCRGTLSIDISSGKIPVLKFKFLGKYAAPADIANATPTLTGFKTPKIVSNTNTTAFSVCSYAGKLESMSVDLGNSVIYRATVGRDEIQITERKSKGSVKIEACNIADFDAFTNALGTTLGGLAIQHGQSAGYICSIASSGVKLTKPDYSDSNGVVMHDLSFDLVPSTSGNDEITITFT
jgi:hypothetical protein